MNGWFELLEGEPSDQVLGDTVVSALAQSGALGAIPSPNSFAPMLKAVEVERYVDYLLGTLSVTVETREQVLVTPNKNLGLAGGFVPLDHRAQRLRLEVAPAELGAAIRLVLEQAS